MHLGNRFSARGRVEQGEVGGCYPINDSTIATLVVGCRKP